MYFYSVVIIPQAMNNTNNSINTERNFDIEGYFSVFIGFVFAFTNHLFGWISNPLSISDWNGYVQAAVAGVIGATMSFFVSLAFRKK